MKRYVWLLILTLLFTACTAADPEPGAIPTVEEVVKRQEVEVTAHRVEQHCLDEGGHYEDWGNDDGTSTTYCIMPEGYGCDPEEFFKGNCGMFIY